MIDAWLVVREEKHVDMKFWVCLNRDDAIKIAQDVTIYWVEKYRNLNPEVDAVCLDDRIYSFNAEDCFHVYVDPVKIREEGEHDPLIGT